LQKHQQLEQTAGLIGRQSPSQTEATMGTLVVGRLEGVRSVRAHLMIKDVSAICQKEPRVVCPRPLCLQKWNDRCEAEVGDVVTFTLKYSNQGDQPISDVVVSDSLTARLEYIPGSAQTSRSAVFTTQPNESGSVILRWQINGVLQPGQSGVVRFQAKV